MAPYDHGSFLLAQVFENSPFGWFQAVCHKWDGKVATGHAIWTLVYYCDLQTIVSAPISKRFFTFNDSPRCFPAQDSFAIHLVLLVTAHYCKWHAFLLGRDTWKDPLNSFQRPAPPWFPIHLSTSQLNKHKAFSKGRDSPEQNFTGCPFHPSVLSLEFWTLAFQVFLHPNKLCG